MYKIGVIGDRDSVLGFKAVGLDVFPCSRREDARETLHDLAGGEYAIIYITEGLAAELEKDCETSGDHPYSGKGRPFGNRDGQRKKIRRAGCWSRHTIRR